MTQIKMSLRQLGMEGGGCLWEGHRESLLRMGTWGSGGIGKLIKAKETDLQNLQDEPLTKERANSQPRRRVP